MGEQRETFFLSLLAELFPENSDINTTNESEDVDNQEEVRDETGDSAPPREGVERSRRKGVEGSREGGRDSRDQGLRTENRAEGDGEGERRKVDTPAFKETTGKKAKTKTHRGSRRSDPNTNAGGEGADSVFVECEGVILLLLSALILVLLSSSILSSQHQQS